ncbi:hypothetical protein C0995_010883 [Termitomyces sp. Mi166|nr:hypothetical protein C0995_010883 [Termitomyces sp. Mi166\
MANKALDLFPNPSLPPSRISPSHWPGISHDATTALRALLAANHEKNHMFFNSRGFHNHLSHWLLALWGLGADTDIIRAAHKLDDAYQKPSFESPEAITRDNFVKFLGDSRFYTAYRQFFTEAVQSKGLWDVLEEFVFSKNMNFGDSGTGPEMFNRFLDGLVHPLIHIGYGVEFGLPGMVVEGLASTAVHQATSSPLIPMSLWSSTPSSAIDSVTSQLPSALTIGDGTPQKNVHALTILARILKDPRFENIENRLDITLYTQVIDKHSEALNKYVSQWTFDNSVPGELERKIEELVWVNVIIYGIGGWTKDKDYNADFFHMHLVTSSLFLSSLAANLKPASQETLLRGYFAVSLAWWIGRGRPAFDIEGFFAEDTAFPAPSGPFPPLNYKALPEATSPKATTPNPWFPIIQAALTVPDDHIPKLHRALVHFASLYGSRAPGQPDFANTELPFADKLDGSLFVRTAGLTNQRLLRPREEPEYGGFWDRQGFYKS